MPREVLGLRRAVHRPARPARRQGQAREARAAGPVQDGAPPRLPRAVRGAREGETPDGDRRRGRGPVDDRDAAPKPRDDAPRHLRGPEVHPRPDADHDGFLQELGRRDREDRHRAQLLGADRLDQPDLARQLPRLHRALPQRIGRLLQGQEGRRDDAHLWHHVSDLRGPGELRLHDDLLRPRSAGGSKALRGPAQAVHRGVPRPRRGGGGPDHGLAPPTAAARTAAPRRPPARTTRTPAPRGALRRASAAAARLARPGLQTRLAARSAEPPRPPLGSHYQDYRLASRRAPPSLRGRRSARTTRITDSPRGALRRASAAAARLALPLHGLGGSVGVAAVAPAPRAPSTARTAPTPPRPVTAGSRAAAALALGGRALDRGLPAVELTPVELRDRVLRLFRRRHLDEPEAARLSGEPVGDHSR